VTVEKGQRYRKEFAFTLDQVRRFAEVTGDSNPIHLDRAYAEKAGFKGVIVHGFLVGSVISRILGTEFPGQGTIYLSQTMSFKAPVYPGEALVAELEVLEVSPSGKCTIKTVISSKDSGEVKMAGEALVLYRG
jgi:acyl dehydratase